MLFKGVSSLMLRDLTPFKHSLMRITPCMFQLLAKKKQQKELLRKKNYEIDTLKARLTERDRTLHAREKRLYSLETSLVSRLITHLLKVERDVAQR